MWYWVPGDLNIADWITRGEDPLNLFKGSAWQEGPLFLCLPEDEWPIESTTNLTELPELLKTTFIVAKVEANEIDSLASRIDITRFSKLELLRNTTARVLRLYNRFNITRKSTNVGKGELTSEDRN